MNFFGFLRLYYTRFTAKGKRIFSYLSNFVKLYLVPAGRQRDENHVVADAGDLLPWDQNLTFIPMEKK